MGGGGGSGVCRNKNDWYHQTVERRPGVWPFEPVVGVGVGGPALLVKGN